MNDLGKMMLVAGLLLVVFGAILCTNVGRTWFGRLPGDIQYSRGNFSFYFPIVTCIVVSVVLTVLMWLFKK